MIDIKLTQTIPSYVSNSLNDEKIEVKGFALHTGTFNMITIGEEELSKSVNSLIGKPILKNHDNSVESVIGQITSAEEKVDPSNGKLAIEYTAEIDAKEEDLIRKMNLGFVTSTSVGFKCEQVCSICGKSIFDCPHWFDDESFQILAENIQFHELSIVAVPADKDASVKISFSKNGKEMQFEDLKELKEKRRTTMSDFEKKYNETVEQFNEFKLQKTDEINELKEEFKATKEKLEADKADKVEEVLSLKNEIETLSAEKESLTEKVAEFEEKFNEIEAKRLSSLREEVKELNEKVNGDLTEEEINSFEEATLNRYVKTFSHISEHMVKLSKPMNESQTQNTYKNNETDDNVSLADKLTGNLHNLRGF